MHNLKDMGAYLRAAGGGEFSATAGGTGDATEQVGVIVDQTVLNLRSGLAVLFGEADLADGETLSMLIKIEHGNIANLSDKADYDFGGDPGSLGVIATGATAVSVADIELAAAIRIDLTGVKRYWRVAVTPTHSAGSTDVSAGAYGVVAAGEFSPQTA